MQKSALRTQYRQRRRALTESDWQTRCEAIHRHFFDWLAENQSESLFLHTFLPIERQKEVDTWRLIRGLWQDYSTVRIAVPVTRVENGTLAHYEIFPDTVFRPSAYGIPEPDATGPELPPSAFRLVLVPLLAFDRTGQRVGYGGGYYDRFLAECRPDCRKVGLSLFEPVDRIDDVFAGDVRLDACLSPDRVWSFANDGG